MVDKPQVIYRTPRRPVDKDVIFFSKDAVGTTQVETIVRTSDEAETFNGAIISGQVVTATNAGVLAIALVYAADGAAGSLAFTDGSTMISPEQDVLWSDVFELSRVQDDARFFANIKTKRKMKRGDKIIMVYKATAADVGDLSGVFTAFYKQ